MERNSTIAAWRLSGGINSAADKGVSAMILSYHDSVPPTFADKQVNAHGRVHSRGVDVAGTPQGRKIDGRNIILMKRFPIFLPSISRRF